ncbi:MAG TPA: alpha/beta fold hydrolase [Desulforhopalus sp.]|jgi:fermentation-respiration switch protein FrsA (DUF1100 family)|nr:alpha/beta fold hydrolase [Desulforhopalus sp.]
MNPSLTTLDIPEINALLFKPDDFGNTALPESAEIVAFPVAEQVRLHCTWYPAGLEDPLLWYFHDGRGQKAADLTEMALAYNRHGISVFQASYRGFGDSDGTPRLGLILSDAEELFDQALLWLGEKGRSGPVFLLGHGLGTLCAIATTLARSKAIKGILLESGIGETIPYLQALGLDCPALSVDGGDGFNTLAAIQKIELPTLIFHGSRDSFVGAAEAEKLQAASGAKNKQFFIIPGAGRNNLAVCGGELYYQTIKKFIDGVCGVNTWRSRRRQFKNDQGGVRQ